MEPAPAFVTVIVYVAPVCPCVKDPMCVFATMRSGGETIVESDAVGSDIDLAATCHGCRVHYRRRGI